MQTKQTHTTVPLKKSNDPTNNEGKEPGCKESELMANKNQV